MYLYTSYEKEEGENFQIREKIYLLTDLISAIYAYIYLAFFIKKMQKQTLLSSFLCEDRMPKIKITKRKRLSYVVFSVTKKV